MPTILRTNALDHFGSEASVTSPVRIAWLGLILTGPLHAQGLPDDPDGSILVMAATVAREELARQHVGPEAQVVFDMRRMRRRGDLHPGTGAPFTSNWGEGQLQRVTVATGMSLGTLDDVRKCTTLRSGQRSCSLRPARAVVAAAQPQISGSSAVIQVHLWFQPSRVRRHPETGEPFEVHHTQAIRIDLERNGNRWTVTRTILGPPGTSIGR